MSPIVLPAHGEDFFPVIFDVEGIRAFSSEKYTLSEMEIQTT